MAKSKSVRKKLRNVERGACVQLRSGKTGFVVRARSVAALFFFSITCKKKEEQQMRDTFVFAVRNHFVFGVGERGGTSAGTTHTEVFERIRQLYHPETTRKPDIYMLDRYYLICEAIRMEYQYCEQPKYSCDPNKTVLPLSERFTMSFPHVSETVLKYHLLYDIPLRYDKPFIFNSEYIQGQKVYITYSYSSEDASLEDIKDIVEDVAEGAELTDYTLRWTFQDLFEHFGLNLQSQNKTEIQENLYQLLLKIKDFDLYTLRETVHWYNQEVHQKTEVKRTLRPEYALRLQSVKKAHDMDYRHKLCIFLHVLTKKAENINLEREARIYSQVCLLFGDTLFAKLDEGMDFVAAAYEYCEKGGKLSSFNEILKAFRMIFEQCDADGANMYDFIRANEQALSDKDGLEKVLRTQLLAYMDLVASKLRIRYVSSNPRLLELRERFPLQFLAKNERNGVLYASPSYHRSIVLAKLTLDLSKKSATLSFKIEDQSIQEGVKEHIKEGLTILPQIRNRYSDKNPLEYLFDFQIKEEHDGNPKSALTNNQSKVPLFGEEVQLTVTPLSINTFHYALEFDDFLEETPAPEFDRLRI